MHQSIYVMSVLCVPMYGWCVGVGVCVGVLCRGCGCGWCFMIVCLCLWVCLRLYVYVCVYVCGLKPDMIWGECKINHCPLFHHSEIILSICLSVCLSIHLSILLASYSWTQLAVWLSPPNASLIFSHYCLLV